MELDMVAEGLQFPEGPVAMADGSVVLVEIRRDRPIVRGSESNRDLPRIFHANFTSRDRKHP